MAGLDADPAAPLRRSLESGRVHSAYLISGPGDAPLRAALGFVRGLVCTGEAPRPCERCLGCRRSAPREEPALDGTGKKGPLYRHVGDHPDLLFVARGEDDTRVRIGQIRALQAALRLRPSEGGARAALIADAEWLNQEAQNALLRLLEEPPPRTTLVLVAASAAGLLATLRSRCQRVSFRAAETERWLGPEAPEASRALAERLERLGAASLPEILDWAEGLRGARGEAAAAADLLLETATAWLHRRVVEDARGGERDFARELAAFAAVRDARRALVQRNANPQMVAERALLALHEAAVR